MCVCELKAIKTGPSEFEAAQRTEMTSSLPHPALLEDLSKTCAPLSPCTLQIDGVPASSVFFFFFFVRECLFGLQFIILDFAVSRWVLTSFVVRLACFSR